MKITTVKINEIKLNPNNPRLIKDDKFAKLVQSIKDFPEMLNIRPIVVNDDMVILGGNMRFKACKEAGLKEVPIIKASGLSTDKQREFLIKDNVSGGEWDWGILEKWDALQLGGWGIDVPIFDTNINDIEEVKEFNESVSFTIKCESIEQLEQLQTKLNTSSKKLNYEDFLIKVGL
jgi:ParB-like chromosome segregation protein Spo0J